MKNILLIAFILFCLNSCSKNEYSECLEEKFDNFKCGRACKGSTIDEYKFQGKTVYVLEAQKCYYDGASEVIDESCNLLGSLGTEAGIYSINGETFYENAVLVQTIWKKK